MMTSKSSLRRSALLSPSRAAAAAGGGALSLAASQSRWAWSAVFCAVVLVGCGGSPGGSSGANNAPIANAGAGQTVSAGTTVTLNGSASSDPDNDPLTYSWVIAVRPPASAAILSNPTSVTPTFVPDAPGDYTISLVVTDNRSAASASPSNVLVRVTGGNQPPIANSGPDQSVVVGQTVTLDGVQSTDFNRDPLTYSWQVRKPDGSVITPNNANSALATFVADQAGSYVASLTVNDGAVSGAVDTVTITAGTGNVAPTANAGPHTPDHLGRARFLLLTASPLPVVMDGSASRDANGEVITFSWAFNARPPGSAAALSSSAGTPSVATFVPDVAGTYRPQLTTSDRLLTSTASAATVVLGTGNVQPNAVAGNFYQTVVAGTTVTLDGSRSFDANTNDTLQYSWTLVSKPTGSTAALSSPVLVRPTFVADRAGVYVASLVVSDGQLSSISDATAVQALAQAGPYDGSWSGTTSQQGTVSFGVNASQVSSITFTWFPTVGTCVSTATTVTTTYNFVPPKPMDTGSFTITESTGDVRAISATFSGLRQASGSMNLQYTSPSGCVQIVPVTFTASRP